MNQRADRLLSLVPVLHRLDVLLDRLLKATQARGGVTAASLRGLFVSPEEVEQLLARPPGAPWFERAGQRTHEPLGEGIAPLEILARQYDLGPFDLDLFLIALAPELDLRYERLYGFFQDDVTRRRATVDLALNLRTTSPTEKVARLVHLTPDAPLIRNRVLHLVPDPNHMQPALLAHYLVVDPQILAALLGRPGMDARLAGFCRALPHGPDLDGLQIPAEMRTALRGLGHRAVQKGQSLTLHFHGPAGSGRSTTARAFAKEMRLGVLAADLRFAGETEGDFHASLRTLFREARLHHLLLYLEGVDELRGEARTAQYRALMAMIRRQPRIIILAGSAPWTDTREASEHVVDVPFGIREPDLRRSVWQEELARHDVTLPEAALDTLADRFRVTVGQIVNAIDSAASRAAWRGAAHGESSPAAPGIDDIFACARDQSGQELGRLTHRIEPKQRWDDIVLPEDDAAQLRELRDQANLRQRVFGAWGFERKLSGGKGLSALFAGPPGTGKTMAAEVIASELRLDLCKIDLAQVVSKYIGETEKNFDRVFRAAENAAVVLFFDEADALFGKRSEVKESHDRYANIEIAYLLQKMEEYEGVAILATNLRQNLDEAFVRRLQFVVEFPFPDEAHRRRIWQVTFPCETPLDADVDFTLLAREVKLAGGNIRNIAVAAAFRATAEESPVRMQHLLHAARREYQKLGRTWSIVA